MLNEPLGLPKGSIRAILALGTVGASIACLVKQIITFEQFITMNTAVFAFYFGTKKEDSKIELSSEEKEKICDA